MDGAGPQRGRKDGPPDSYLEPLNPHGSPFFFGFQKPFFFQQGKRNGFCRPRKVRTVQNALSGISHSAPLLVLSPRDPLRWARAGTPFWHVVWRAGVVAPHKIEWCHGRVWEAAQRSPLQGAKGNPATTKSARPAIAGRALSLTFYSAAGGLGCCPPPEGRRRRRFRLRLPEGFFSPPSPPSLGA